VTLNGQEGLGPRSRGGSRRSRIWRSPPFSAVGPWKPARMPVAAELVTAVPTDRNLRGAARAYVAGSGSPGSPARPQPKPPRL
jgi:hypothetical protein